jgi:hypothetical protein
VRIEREALIRAAAANPDANRALSNNDNAAREQMFLKLIEIGQNQCQLLRRPALALAPQENHRGLSCAGSGQEGTEICVSGDQDPLFNGRVLENDTIVSSA